jgi:NarL family two-component system response regulator LiaR
MIFMPSVVIIEDHPLMRNGLAAYFAGTGRWRVLGSAQDVESARPLLSVPEAMPDILIIDIQLGNGWGLDIIPWLRNRGAVPPVVVYSTFADYAHVNTAFGMGVRGYVSKNRNGAELEAALEAVLRGEIYTDAEVERELVTVDDTLALLTKREGEVLALVRTGLSNKNIAERLCINRRTVENILSCIYDKTGIHSRFELHKL